MVLFKVGYMQPHHNPHFRWGCVQPQFWRGLCASPCNPNFIGLCATPSQPPFQRGCAHPLCTPFQRGLRTIPISDNPHFRGDGYNPHTTPSQRGYMQPPHNLCFREGCAESQFQREWYATSYNHFHFM